MILWLICLWQGCYCFSRVKHYGRHPQINCAHKHTCPGCHCKNSPSRLSITSRPDLALVEAQDIVVPCIHLCGLHRRYFFCLFNFSLASGHKGTKAVDELFTCWVLGPWRGIHVPVVLGSIWVLENSCDSRVSAGELGKIFPRNEKIKPERHSGEM